MVASQIIDLDFPSLFIRANLSRTITNRTGQNTIQIGSAV